MDTNGDTASLKRKREPKDDPALSQKKHRRKSKLQGNATGEDASNDAALQQTDDDLELLDASSQSLSGPVRERVASWKLSKPMGGRMLDIDPVFSPDERHLIIPYNTSIQVYSTEDSLLVRRIALPLTRTDGENEFVSAHIVAAVLSKCDTDYVWVACSDGRIWHINWTSGSGADTPFRIEAKKVLDVTVDAVELGGKSEDVLLVLQRLTKGSAQVVAYNTKALSARTGKLVHTYDESPQLLRSVAGGRCVVAAAKGTLHIGLLKAKKPASLDDLAYRFHCFDVPDVVSCLDIRHTLRTTKKGGFELQSVDLAVGCARGAIYVYHDLLSKLPGEGSGSSKAGMIQPKKYHWHRRAVHSVKWSLDGNYLISGGYETVLVLWQVDTGRLDFLPHLSATIENIVVSPRGSSYAVHLDDNSTMILSTAEMKPTTYVSGIQSLVLGDRPSKESLIRRVWRPADEIATPLIAAVNPQSPSQMFLCVGNGQQASLGASSSTPLLQVFDISSFHGVTKHAIARTNPTDANITSEGVPVTEPTATKLAFSRDGKWLVSVDEWQPPERDADAFLTGSKTPAEACLERREIYLKFWEIGAEDQSFQLVTRINDAHHTDRTEPIFDLASDPTSSQFATIGNDGTVRFWAPRMRKRDGLAATGPDGEPLRSWVCSRTVSLPVYEQQDDSVEAAKNAPRSGAITFSEDGSILFAAFGPPSGALVVAIDTETGAFRDVVSGMFKGEIRAMKSLGSSLIMLSEDLVVYDIVSDELLYSYALKETSEAAKRLTQLAVNYDSRSVALVAPVPNQTQEKLKRGARSELVVFSVEEDEPRLITTFPQLITSVSAAPSSSGFIVVDSAAQIWSVTEGAEQAPLLQPLADLGVDDSAAAEEPTPDELQLQEGDASDEEMEDADQDVEVEDEDDTHAAVVAPQRLAEIFNAAPAFAMPPIEDIFYQVAGLFSTKPVNA
ncbi:WD40-repeat-containing domain protein [Parachaetomium inaequale]|uniref:WD40-repeat-containing domain protein n=1 Tax=Parachaetomium inaequale TaxID=2588326 RepID=A0AAN6PIW5_9PEZI|nr:WD40-repeat-containing domain protein [Parachaetomium inaequale]